MPPPAGPPLTSDYAVPQRASPLNVRASALARRAARRDALPRRTPRTARAVSNVDRGGRLRAQRGPRATSVPTSSCYFIAAHLRRAHRSEAGR
ncbi:MAG: hypothetical protein MZV64_67820 [Ignavibacteriales bacterium]|nr:hypothetical protein [Ignavibacteriales bacterium]